MLNLILGAALASSLLVPADAATGNQAAPSNLICGKDAMEILLPLAKSGIRPEAVSGSGIPGLAVWEDGENWLLTGIAPGGVPCILASGVRA